jgi:hypothetical protein
MKFKNIWRLVNGVVINTIGCRSEGPKFDSQQDNEGHLAFLLSVENVWIYYFL